MYATILTLSLLLTPAAEANDLSSDEVTVLKFGQAPEILTCGELELEPTQPSGLWCGLTPKEAAEALGYEVLALIPSGFTYEGNPGFTAGDPGFTYEGNPGFTYEGNPGVLAETPGGEWVILRFTYEGNPSLSFTYEGNPS